MQRMFYYMESSKFILYDTKSMTRRFQHSAPGIEIQSGLPPEIPADMSANNI